MDSPMIFNITGKAMPALVCSRKTVICWCCLKLVSVITAIKKGEQPLKGYKIDIKYSWCIKVTNKGLKDWHQIKLTLISGVCSTSSSPAFSCSVVSLLSSSAAGAVSPASLLSPAAVTEASLLSSDAAGASSLLSGLAGVSSVFGMTTSSEAAVTGFLTSISGFPSFSRWYCWM